MSQLIPMFRCSLDRMGRLLLLLAAIGAGACGPQAPPAAAPTTGDSDSRAGGSIAPSRPPLPPMTPEEQALEAELRQEVEALLLLGSREYDTWSLADATDHLASRLEGYGYEVSRRGFSWQGRIAQNLEVSLPGLRRGDEAIVITARVDANPGSPGADDNASGAVALLALARHLQGQRRQRAVRLVWLSSAGARDDVEAQGAFNYLEQQREAAVRMVAAIELQGLGHFSDEILTQRYPAGVMADSRKAGDFVVILSHPDQTLFAERAGVVFRRHCSMPVQQWVVLRDDPFVARSAHSSFVARGVPSLMVTDTQRFRSPAFGTVDDTGALLDYGRMARVVHALVRLVEDLAGPAGQPPAAAGELQNTMIVGSEPAICALATATPALASEQARQAARRGAR